MPEIPREERILNLLSALLAARAPLSWAELREEVAGYDDDATPDALEKRFDRDKADLRKLGVPLEWVAEDAYGRTGYRIAKDRFFLDEIRFTFEEGIVLAALVRALAADSSTLNLRSALVKISVDSPLTEAFRESIGEQQLLDPKVAAEEASGRLPELAAALGARRPVRFRYYSLSSGTEAERTVELYGMGYSFGHWYLVGRDVAKREERVFRASRIRGRVETLPPSDYGIPEDFDLKARIGRPRWLLPGGRPVTARVRFDPELAWMIGENVRPGQTFVREEDGGGVLTLPATDPEALVEWVAQYGPSAEIVEPPELRERIAEHLRAIVARYES